MSQLLSILIEGIKITPFLLFSWPNVAFFQSRNFASLGLLAHLFAVFRASMSAVVVLIKPLVLQRSLSVHLFTFLFVRINFPIFSVTFPIYTALLGPLLPGGLFLSRQTQKKLCKNTCGPGNSAT
jgi:hypothetical protein